MTLHRIELNEITFGDGSAGKLPGILRYPIYGNLIESAVTAEHHGWLQLEPAFQFLEAADADTYELVFSLGAGDFYFVPGAAGAPAWQEATGGAAPCVTGVSFPAGAGDLKVCTVSVDPAAWGAARVLTLRIFCNSDPGSASYDPHHGVSVTLIGPGVRVPAERASSEPPLVGRSLAIAATIEESAGRAVPRYDIFKPFPLPPSLCLEPALRLSHPGRTSASLKLGLADPGLRFKLPAGGSDEVQLMVDEATEPSAALSRVKTDEERKKIHFTWQRGRAQSFLVFGFSFGVERFAAAENGWKPVEGFDIDPILFNDPPPVGTSI